MTLPDMATVKRLLIVKLSSIGDVTHALPVSAAIGRAFPHVEISWAVEPVSAPLLEGNPYVKEVIVLPAGWHRVRVSTATLRQFRGLRRELSARKFDVAIDLQGLSKSAIVAWASGAPHRYGYDWLRELAPQLEQRVPRRPESIHIVDQFLDVARFLGASAQRVEFPLFISDEDHSAALQLLAEVGLEVGAPFVAVNPSPGAGGNKGWPPDRFAAALDILLEKPGIPAVLIGSSGDLPVADQIQSHMKRRVPSLVGKTSLKQLAALLRQSRLHLCGDTGSAHIAAAVGTRVITLFGRSNPARLAPYGQEEWVIHHRECCVAPCRKFHDTAPVNSKQKCLSPPPACMIAISVDEVVATVRRALA